MILIADTPLECTNNVKDTVCLLQNLGFFIHEKKSIFILTQMITFLGNVIDSVSMTVTLPKEKVDRIKDECFSTAPQPSREASIVIELSAFPRSITLF
jgi:hypothetical protein